MTHKVCETVRCSASAQDKAQAETLYSYQDGIIETVRLALEAASEGKETIPPNIAGALGVSLGIASGWAGSACTETAACSATPQKGKLAAVSHILLTAAHENLAVSPVLAGAFASLLPARQSLDLGSAHADARAQGQALDLGSRHAPLGHEVSRAVPRCTAAQDKANKAGAGTCTDAVSGSARTQEVSGWYTPDEAAALIERIRAWLSGCREGHRLADLMESIKAEFKLYDGQLGELLGISGRLVGYVRHGRPSPFALSRFTEVFGEAGGASTHDAVRG